MAGVVVHHLKEAVGVLVTEVNVDHLQQHSDFIIAHLVVVVLVSPAQVRVNPGEDTHGQGSSIEK